MARVTVAVRPRGGSSLRDLLLEQGIPVRSDCGGQGTCGKCRVRVTDAAGTRSVLACGFVPESAVAVEVRNAKVPAGSERVPVRSELALAADIGTTTISLAAVDIRSGRVVRSRELLNPQLPFGADVMTRISQWRAVRKVDVLEPVKRFMCEIGIGSRRAAVLVGNTAIIHFVLGRDPSRLGVYPYCSRVPVGKPVMQRLDGLRVWVPPLLDSFVGADCTAAIIASGMHQRKGLELLVDAGTNGEVVLGNRERLLVCSTAAGPAFEGATLECGSLAEPGSIRSVRARGRGLAARTVGNREPRSICGSGVLSGVRAAVATGRLDPSGRVRKSGRVEFSKCPSVYLSQADIREVQLAVAALSTGIKLLLAEAGRRAADIDRLHLTGKFGAAIDPGDATAIGLLPDVAPGRTRRHSNLALKGAVLLAAEPRLRRDTLCIARMAEEVRLSGHEDFEETFVESLRLAPWH